MMRFTLRQLQYFVAAAEAGSITLAAEQIHISQPSISGAISQLETELGVTLFIRRYSQGLSLTPVGKRIYSEAKAMLEVGEKLYEAANQAGKELHGAISVGCLVTLAPMLIPELCHRFSMKHKNIEMEIVEGSQDHLIEMVRRGELDIFLSYLMHIPDDIRFETLISLPPCVLLPVSHPLASRSKILMEELRDEPYIMLDLPFSRDYFLSLFSMARVSPKITRRSSQPEVVRTMVANGYGVSIVVARPRNENALDNKPTVSVPLGGNVKRLELGYAVQRRKVPTRIQSAFEEHVRKSITQRHIPGMRPV